MSGHTPENRSCVLLSASSIIGPCAREGNSEDVANAGLDKGQCSRGRLTGGMMRINSSLAFTALPSILTLATSTSAASAFAPGLPIVNSSGLNGHQHCAKMSTDATAASSSSHHNHRTQQPMLASQRAKQQREAEMSSQAEDLDKGRPKGGRGMWNFFPLGYKEAAYQWWTSVTPQQAERNVLNLVPYLREATTATSLEDGAVAKSDPFGPRVWKSSLVQLSGKNRGLNELSIERVGEKADETLVMLHGYGAGLGFFYKNFEPLSRLPGWKLYALDMLGMGNSARPPFKIHAKDPKGKVTEAENWFIDALEEWRIARKIDKFTLMGHSLGGYLAVSYALKYPGRLNKLILASPVGIPEDPYAVNASMPEPEESTFQNEFIQDGEGVVSPDGKSPNPGLDASNKAAASKSGTIGSGAPKRPIPGWLVWLWDANVSPFSFVRLAGPLGPRVVSGWTSRRFNHLPQEESRILHDYAYSLFRQKGSGEYALPFLLAPGAYARNPVINRIQEVGRGLVKAASDDKAEVRETGIPVVMMYGSHDWMDVAGGYAAEEKIKQRVVKALMTANEEERKKENGSAKVIIVKNAGHHLYLENPEDFNAYVVKELKETQEYNKRVKALER